MESSGFEMGSLEVSARFGLPPNSKRYCGNIAFAGAFKKFLAKKNAANRKALENAMRPFTAHYAYLKLIAEANGKKPFDPGVPEALWLGNGLLGKVRKKEMQKLILKEFCGEGMLSAKRARALASSMPDGFLPHHSFHVLYLHTISGVIEPSVGNADLCRPSWGKVISVNKDSVLAETQKLVRKKGKLLLIPCRKEWKTSCAGIKLLPAVKKGDLVASHWGVAVMRITKGQKKALEKVTLQNIKAANGM
jgi:hypothetical protein